MTPPPDYRRRPLDLSAVQNFSFDRSPHDRGAQSTEKEPTSGLPFHWPEIHKRDSYLIEHTIDTDGNPLRLQEQAYTKGETTPLTLKEYPSPEFQETVTRPAEWEPYANTNLQQLKDPEGENIYDAEYTHNGTLIAVRDTGDQSLLTITQDGTTKILKHPTIKKYGTPRIASDGTIVTSARESTLLLRTPDGATIILENPELGLINPIIGSDGTIVATQRDKRWIRRRPDGVTIRIEEMLSHPSLAPDGTLIAERRDGTLLLLTPDGITTILADPEGKELSLASLAPDGTLTAQRSGGSILLRAPNGTVTILRDPEGQMLTRPRIAPDGTLIAGKQEIDRHSHIFPGLRNTSDILLRLPNQSVVILQDPKGKGFNDPILTPDNTLFAKKTQQNFSALVVRAIPIHQTEKRTEEPPIHQPPRRTF